jgi:hypothetical protein
MPFTAAQKSRFIALLQSKGWQLRDNMIYLPDGGLWFGDSHFQDWGALQMHDIFTQRAARIAKAQFAGWEGATRENKEAAWAAEEVIKYD